jgi:hypothetical protein
VNSSVNALMQCTSITPKLTLNAAPNIKCWSLSLLQMVTLFQAQAQAQAQPTMAATLFYRKRFLCLGSLFHNYWQEIISSKTSKIQP